MTCTNDWTLFLLNLVRLRKISPIGRLGILLLTLHQITGLSREPLATSFQGSCDFLKSWLQYSGSRDLANCVMFSRDHTMGFVLRPVITGPQMNNKHKYQWLMTSYWKVLDQVFSLSSLFSTPCKAQNVTNAQKTILKARKWCFF